MKLNPEELEVVSFDTTDAAAEAELALAPAVGAALPTPATWCFICPPITYGCGI